ncbi:MAG TPA: hypothetical protein VMS76_01650, partial [Planctomycetota bacterium]|nr:hypothetical protein [Planctomycetota bacterium]
SLRYDPIEALDLQGVTLPKPIDAWQGTAFKIAYIDKGGKLRIWSGSEAKFQWNRVQNVVDIRRYGDLDFNDDDGDGKADDPSKSTERKRD